MCVGTLEEPLLPLHGPVDVGVGHRVFLGESMDQHGRDSSVKEVEEPIVDSTEPCSKLVDAITQVVGLRAAELVAELRETSDASDTPGIGGLVILPQLP